MKNRMTYINGLRITLSAYAILTAEQRETTRIKTVERMRSAGLVEKIGLAAMASADRHRLVLGYTLTPLGRQVADELRREAQRGE